ncbi:MAG: tRNA lysidine(34) synthetase TilS [Deltaproteobacteria bacterium]|nr:tRNA lysidine(34) synthetase TilS [Deltaproteobacteria bacterium]
MSENSQSEVLSSPEEARLAEAQALREEFCREMARLCPNFESGRYVLGFSGGGDSVALAALLAETVDSSRLKAVILDHRCRPDSEEEALRAAIISQNLGIKSEIFIKDVPYIAVTRGKGLEEAGRHCRYALLEEERVKFGADYALVGHQRDDLVETILLKIARGGGPGALVGIRPKVGRILRPLLPFRRARLREFLKTVKIPYLDDPSNSDERFGRNFARRRLAPLFSELNPAFHEALSRAAQIALGEEDYWEERLNRLCAEGKVEIIDWLEAQGEIRPRKKQRITPGKIYDPREWDRAEREYMEEEAAKKQAREAKANGLRRRAPQARALAEALAAPPPPADPDAPAPPDPFLDRDWKESVVARRAEVAVLGFKFPLAFFSLLAEAEKKRFLGRLFRLVEIPRCKAGGEPVSLETVLMALKSLAGSRGVALDLPGGRGIARRGEYVYIGPASRFSKKGAWA